MGKDHPDTLFSQRLRKAMGGETQERFAKRLRIPQSQLARYLAGQIPGPRLLMKLAQVTGRSIDWLLLGQGAREVLLESAAALKDLGAGTVWPKKGGELVHRVSQTEYAMMLNEAAHIAAEAPAVYRANAKTILSLIDHIRQLTPEEQETLSRFLEALRSGDEQVKEHLINQMKVVERALTTRRTRTKKSELA